MRETVDVQVSKATDHQTTPGHPTEDAGVHSSLFSASEQGRNVGRRDEEAARPLAECLSNCRDVFDGGTDAAGDRHLSQGHGKALHGPHERP